MVWNSAPGAPFPSVRARLVTPDSKFPFNRDRLIEQLMKRLLLLAAALIVTLGVANAQTPRRTLVEEFTNTGCPPCAISDPYMEAWEAKNLSDIVVLKYHWYYPDQTDPYYTINATEMKNRTAYYGINGVPAVKFDGVISRNPYYGEDTLTS